ncbi:MAG TPA: hypothetical protein VGV67_10065 [Solirubrobacteraceae bacterium]|nr:hypothetical protein [Solirubrobacteraceae bacterium]
MSQVSTQHRIPAPAQPGPTRAAWISALLALAAAVVVTLVIALGGDSSTDSPAADVQSVPALRADGGPEESGVAAAIGSRGVSAPSETAVAAAIGAGSQQSAGRPDESRVAAAISTR